MKILSIDVGIKNLAFCLFDKLPTSEHFNVTKWDIINLTEEETLKCSFVEKNEVCNKPAKFKKDDKCYCLKHSKKQQYQIPTSEQSPTFINKQKIANIYEIADNHNIKYDPKIKKVDLSKLINEHIQKIYFETIESKKAKEVELFNIGVNIKNKFNDMFKDEGKIDYVIIENQIGPIANKMKTIQGMLSQYFIMRNNNILIDFISATNKLKDFIPTVEEKAEKAEKVEKMDYKQRKKLGIQTTLNIVNNDFRFKIWSDFLHKHNKKDDLSDCFLQGMWYIKHKI
jgi:hypothetical protein